MRDADVLMVLDVLIGAGIQVWVDGGWGVDALLGAQTRPHDDLDLVIDHLDADQYRTLMAANGFRVLTSRHNTPRNFVMVDAAGREVDVHLVDRRVVVRGDDGVDVYGPNGLEYEVGALDGTGTIAERRVACCTAEFQVRSHTGYTHDAEDAHDVRALHERFGIPLPPQYETGSTQSGSA